MKAKVVAIVTDPVDKSTALAGKLNLAFPILSDPDMVAIRAYGSEHIGKDIARPASFVITQSGTVAYGYIGDSPVDRPTVDDLITEVKKAAQAGDASGGEAP